MNQTGSLYASSKLLDNGDEEVQSNLQTGDITWL
jgi:hypothetical protein